MKEAIISNIKEIVQHIMRVRLSLLKRNKKKRKEKQEGKREKKNSYVASLRRWMQWSRQERSSAIPVHVNKLNVKPRDSSKHHVRWISNSLRMEHLVTV
jgi:hypothetical protein